MRANMEHEEIVRLLKQRPGYEAVYKLRQSDQRRKDLAQYVGTSGGTLQRWIADADAAGLISTEKDLVDDEVYVEISLSECIPDELVQVVEDRGGRGPRDDLGQFADIGGPSAMHHWKDSHSL